MLVLNLELLYFVLEEQRMQGVEGRLLLSQLLKNKNNNRRKLSMVYRTGAIEESRIIRTLS